MKSIVILLLLALISCSSDYSILNTDESIEVIECDITRAFDVLFNYCDEVCSSTQEKKKCASKVTLISDGDKQCKCAHCFEEELGYFNFNMIKPYKPTYLYKEIGVIK